MHLDYVGYEDLVVVGNNHVLDDNTAPIPMCEVAALPMFLPRTNRSYRDFIEKAFAKEGHSLLLARELETVDALLTFIMEGEGVTILPYSSVWREVELGRIVTRRIIDPTLSRRICLATKHKSSDPLLNHVITILKQVIQETRAQTRWYA